jgi:hypothetical protein
MLNNNGDADVSGWFTTTGASLKGGTYSVNTYSTTSSRYYGSYNANTESPNYGFRAVRTQ